MSKLGAVLPTIMLLCVFLNGCAVSKRVAVESTDSASQPHWTPEAAARVNALNDRMWEAVTAKQWHQGKELANELVRLDGSGSDYLYLAFFCVELGQKEEAISALRNAVRLGANDPTLNIADELRLSEDWDPLRSDPRFAKLLTQAQAGRWKPATLHFETSTASPVAFRRSAANNPYLTRLRTQYNLEALIADTRGDMERVKILCTWVHTRWNHVGDAKNQPKDPIGLLEAAATGDNFRCVEYGITVAGCLNAVGIPARVVYARAADVETRRVGAGHVFAEAWLRDKQKWVFVDPQLNVVGELNGQPLNAVEFRNAFAEPFPQVSYPHVLGSCFHYFAYDVDQRYPISERTKGIVTLGPIGAPEPKVFQRASPMNSVLYTHDLTAVYGPPGDPEGT